MAQPRQPLDQDKAQEQPIEAVSANTSVEPKKEQAELASAQALLAQVDHFINQCFSDNVKGEKGVEFEQEWKAFVQQLETQIKNSNNPSIRMLYDEKVIESVKLLSDAIEAQAPMHITKDTSPLPNEAINKVQRFDIPPPETVEGLQGSPLAEEQTKEQEELQSQWLIDSVSIPQLIEPTPQDLVMEEWQQLEEPKFDGITEDEIQEFGKSSPPTESVESESYQIITLTPEEEKNAESKGFIDELNSMIVPSHNPIEKDFTDELKSMIVPSHTPVAKVSPADKVSEADKIDALQERWRKLKEYLNTPTKKQIEEQMNAIAKRHEAQYASQPQRSIMTHNPSPPAPLGQLSPDMTLEKIKLQIFLKEQILALEKLQRQRVFNFPSNSNKANLLKSLKGLEKGLKSCNANILLEIFAKNVKNSLDAFALKVGKNNPSKQSSELAQEYNNNGKAKLSQIVESIVTPRSAGPEQENPIQVKPPKT